MVVGVNKFYCSSSKRVSRFIIIKAPNKVLVLSVIVQLLFFFFFFFFFFWGFNSFFFFWLGRRLGPNVAGLNGARQVWAPGKKIRLVNGPDPGMKKLDPLPFLGPIMEDEK